MFGEVKWFVVQPGPQGLEREVQRLREGGRMVIELSPNGEVEAGIGKHCWVITELRRRLNIQPRESLPAQAERLRTEPRAPRSRWQRFVSWFEGHDLDDDCNCGKD